MRRELTYFLLAVSFFTRLPTPNFKNFDNNDLNQGSKYLPLIGILVGTIGSMALWLALIVFPLEIAVLISLIVTSYFTGCIHEDGLIDTLDGLGGSFEKDRALTIMRDPTIGSFGALGLVFSVLLKFEAINHIPRPTVYIVLISAHSLSRYASFLMMFLLPYIRSEGKAKPFTQGLTRVDLVLATFFGLVPFTFLKPGMIAAVLPVILIWLWFTRKLKSRLGGITGDCLGAMQQLTELCFYLGILVWMSFQ